MVLVSDGVSSVVSDEEVVGLARGAKDPKEAADRILAFAEEMGSEDNATAIVVPLAGWGKIEGPDKTKDFREYRSREMSECFYTFICTSDSHIYTSWKREAASNVTSTYRINLGLLIYSATLSSCALISRFQLPSDAMSTVSPEFEEPHGHLLGNPIQPPIQSFQIGLVFSV